MTQTPAPPMSERVGQDSPACDPLPVEHQPPLSLNLGMLDIYRYIIYTVYNVHICIYIYYISYW